MGCSRGSLARRLARTAASLLCCVLTASTLIAQTNETGALSGRILDESGAALPGVLVSVTNETTAIGEKTLVTGTNGSFSFDLLPPADGYMLKASIPSYATVVAGPLAVVAGRTTRLDLVLKPSSDMEETIHVEAHGEIVDLEDTTTGTTLNEQFIEGIPLVGRHFSDLLTLAPGVTDTDGDGNPNVRGARDTGLQLRLDGTNVTNPLTGHMGQEVNIESIQELEVITSGAPAEYSRADGGFANVITKSGSNDVRGSLKLFYRSDYLDGRGAADAGDEVQPFSDKDLYFTIGGPVVRDHLWYFASVENLNDQTPVSFSDGTFDVTTQRGWRAFGKMTWQVDPDNRLAFQVNDTSLTYTGNNIGPNIGAESDYSIHTGGPTPQLTWTAVLSPMLLLQVIASRWDGRLETEPTADQFRAVEIDTTQNLAGQRVVALPCVSRNCVTEPYLHRYYLPDPEGFQRNFFSYLQSGPYEYANNQDVQRTTVRSDLTYSLDQAWGQHTIKSGFECSLEDYSETQINNPVITDRTNPWPYAGYPIPPVPPSDTRVGRISLQVYDPVSKELTADGFNAGTYLQDSWKPLPNLTINAGVRYDYEDISTGGFTDFNPLAEARTVAHNYELLCNAAGVACVPGLTPASLPSLIFPSAGDPALQFDLNGDGVIETAGAEGNLIKAPFTTRTQRLPDAFDIVNRNLAPRMSLSWDPWNHGKTKLFGTWGKYYDRLFLGAVATGQQAESFTANWDIGYTVDPGTNTISSIFQGDPGTLSNPITQAISMAQTDRELATPYTVEWSAGIERELAPEWAVSLTYVRRRGIDLLQDRDVNHITCKQFDSAFGVDPLDVCGDAGALELDRFGTYQRTPNGAIDLYNLNPNFNQILRVGNYNSSSYHSAEVSLRKRLHHNWQMLFSYTYSKATGDAASFSSLQGNDPAVSDKVHGYLDFDQRHIIRWQAVTHLPHEILLGGNIQWSSGLPYTEVSEISDYDNVGYITPQRLFSLTGKMNDKRNQSLLTVDARVEKRLSLGHSQISAFIEGQNLFNNDELTYTVHDPGAFRDDGTRRFGRRWQIGVAVYY